jgi:phage minor structural protein
MIYLFDKDEKLIKIIRKPAIKTALQKYSLTKERYVSDRLTVEMKALNDDELEKVEYMAIQTMEDAHTFHYFYVAQKSSENLTTLIGVQSGIEELRKSPVFDKRPQNAFAREVINDLLSGTNWQARFVGETTPHSTNFYYISVFDALKKVCEVWDLEMQFFVEMNGNRIGARYIDFKRKIGQAVGKRVVYGHNALQILQEVERTNIFTALIGRGKGEQVSSAEESGKQANGFGRKITFEDVVWSTASGKPVNKPKGQKYVELPAMTKLYGIKNADGSMRPKIGFVDFAEEENPEALIERTYKALVDAARPQLTLKTSSVYLRGAKVGDTIRVVRHDKKLDYDTRIFEITFNRLNDQSSDIKLGDRIGESNEAKAQTIADKAIDEFVANEFTNFVKNLPDYLPTADGFNNNWYGSEDPTGKHQGKVLINDIWYKPDPEHEGHKIMLRWTGEVWEEILRTFSSEALRAKIADEIEKLDKAMKASDLVLKEQTAQSLRTAGANASAIEAAKGAITKLNQDLAGAKRTNQAAIDRLKSDFASAQKTANDQTVLLRNDLANIRAKQSQAEAEISKQVQALNQTKTELTGVKSVQATYEQNTQRRLAELANVADGKVSKSELVQTAQELSSRIASVHLGRRNLLKGTKELARYKPASEYNGFKVIRTVAGATGYQDSYKETTVIPTTGTEYIAIFYARASENDYPVRCHLYNPNTVTLSENSSGYKSRSSDGLSIIRLSTDWQLCWVKWTQTATDQAKTVIIGRHGPQVGGKEGAWVEICAPALFEGNIVGDWSPAYEDQDERVSAVESTVKQRADSLEAGVSSLREGLKTKADSSALNLLSDSIKQSVKSLETDTQNKLNSKLSTAEFEVRASGIRQEILNATKDKADKTLVTAEAGKLREELASQVVGGRNLMGVFNTTPVKSSFEPDTYRFAAKTTKNTTRPTLQLQFRWTDGTYSAVAWISQEGPFKKSFRITKDYTELRIKFNCNKEDAVLLFKGNKFIEINTDYLFTGNLLNLSPNDSVADFLKIERATIPSDWSPALEDTEGLITEAKAVFERTAQGLQMDLAAVQAYVSADGTRAEALRSFSREETARQLTAERKLIEAGYVGKAQHTEDVRSISRRFEELKASSETKLAEYRQTVEGQFATISSQISGKANQTDFQRVQETSKLYERLIGSTEKEVTDKISRMALTNELFQVEVSKNLELRTVQYQIANAWAVQNLNSNGDIVSQINATGPNVRIQGESIHLDGKTLIDNGVIKNAMIESMLADKITAGTLNAAIVNIVNLNANKLVGLDANFIKSKIELALVEWLKGKVITAQNDAMKIDLNNGQYNVMTDQAAIRRVLSGYPNQFLKFTSENEGGAPASVTVLGANRDGTENSKNDSFAGIRLFSGNKVERTEIISDVVRFATGAVNYRGWEMRTLYGNDNRQVILQPFGNVTRSNIVASYFNGIDLTNVLETLNQMMANLANHTGRRDIFGPIPGLGARKYQR